MSNESNTLNAMELHLKHKSISYPNFNCALHYGIKIAEIENLQINKVKSVLNEFYAKLIKNSMKYDIDNIDLKFINEYYKETN
jgi:hypothetical protein